VGRADDDAPVDSGELLTATERLRRGGTKSSDIVGRTERERMERRREGEREKERGREREKRHNRANKKSRRQKGKKRKRDSEKKGK
jgi:hypothetical protein